MSLPTNVVQQLQKVLQENVNRYFIPLKPAEKTADKVKDFAQKQLDFFITGIAKESLELRRKWAKGHPFHVHLKINPANRFFEVQIFVDE
jgi:hypothetical protein